MPASTPCDTLLRSRLSRFSRLLRRLEHDQVGAVQDVRVAARRLRELLPLLPIEGAAARKMRVRLRKFGRRLLKVRDLDRAQRLADALVVTDRVSRDGLARVKEDLGIRRARGRAVHSVKKAAAEGTRAATRLQRFLDQIRKLPDDRARDRTVEWVLRARVARRAGVAKASIRNAGAVYLHDRLDVARAAVRRLRDSVELLAEMTGASHAIERRSLSRAHQRLGQLSDTQRLIDRIRKLQGSLTPPDLKVWQSLDALLTALEHRSRRLHAGYVQERDALVAVCDRLIGRPASTSNTKRKAG